jgi:hypothetical protein
MRLPVVQKKRSKKTQTLDTVASVAKAWGEWQLAKGAGLAAKKLFGGGDGGGGSETATPPPPPTYTGPVPDPNAPGAGDTDTVGASPAAPVAPSVTPDPEAPKTPDK